MLEFAHVDECLRNGAEMLLSRSDDWILSGRVLSDRTRRYRAPHGLRKGDAGISRFLGTRWKRSYYTAPGMGFSRTKTGGQMVRVCYPLEKRARSQPCGSRRS